MIARHAWNSALVGLACAAACGCATTRPTAVSVSETRKLESSLASRRPGPVADARYVDPLQRLAYRYNTTNWSYGPAIDIDRDLAGATGAGPSVTIPARIALAYNLAAIGRIPEAQFALAQARQALASEGAALSAADQRVFTMNLAIGAAVIAGQEAARLTGAEATAKYQLSANLARQALIDGAASTTAAPTAGALTQGDTVILNAAETTVYNAASGRSGLGGVIARGMTAEEKLAVLAVRAEYTEGAALFSLGDQAGATRVNAAALRDLSALPKGVAGWLRVLVQQQHAQLLAAEGNTAGAEATLRASIADLRQIEGESRLEAFLWRALAHIQAGSGDSVGALDSEDRSFQILTDQTDGVWPTRPEVASYLRLLAAKAVAGDPTAVARFFAVASTATETETAASVADVAARFANDDTKAGAAIRRLQIARDDLKAASARLARVEAAQPKPSPGDLQAASDADVAARAAADLAEKETKQVAGAQAGAVLSPKTELPELQAVLRPREAYVRFIFLDDGAGFAIFVTRDQARVVALAARRNQIAADIILLRESTRLKPDGADYILRDYRTGKAVSLYRTLFGDLDLSKVDILSIEPAGPLFSLPFSALLTAQPSEAMYARIDKNQDYSGAPWLGRDHAIELSVGSAAFVRLRGAKASPAPHTILAFANPRPVGASDPGQVQRLSATLATRGLTLASNEIGAGDAVAGVCAEEAKALLNFEPLTDTVGEATYAIDKLHGDAPLVQDTSFTDTAVAARKDLDQYQVLLFATHAALPQRGNPCRPNPFLITTKAVDDPDSEGRLDSTRIAGLTLNADLVVLSACDTGDTSGAGSNGQALGGLAQSFLFAGSRGVVVSHWEVASAQTAQLMKAMFDGLGAHATPDHALAEAERKLMDTPDTSHPYFWAAFTIVGGAASN